MANRLYQINKGYRFDEEAMTVTETFWVQEIGNSLETVAFCDDNYYSCEGWIRGLAATEEEGN